MTSYPFNAELSTQDAVDAIGIFDHFHSPETTRKWLPKWDNETKIVPIANPRVEVRMLPHGKLTVTVLGR